ncbi:MAG: DUF2878 domain-containing protein [Xanthomonadales bacterium]|nr:DUF2878 domain-containing protein [Xanthomonadales bacterium]
MKPVWINALLFQLAWPACVLGAAAGVVWPGLLVVGLMAWHGVRHPVPGDLRLVVAAVAVGLVLGWAWPAFGLLEYSSPAPVTGLAPIWIVALWVALALCLNHCLAWLVHRPLIWPALFGLVGSPLSYWSASRFGATTFIADTFTVLLVLGVAWAAVMAGLAALAQGMRDSTPGFLGETT